MESVLPDDQNVVNDTTWHKEALKPKPANALWIVNQTVDAEARVNSENGTEVIRWSRYYYLDGNKKHEGVEHLGRREIDRGADFRPLGNISNTFNIDKDFTKLLITNLVWRDGSWDEFVKFNVTATFTSTKGWVYNYEYTIDERIPSSRKPQNNFSALVSNRSITITK